MKPESEGLLSAATGATRTYFAHRIVYPWMLPSVMRKHIYTGAMGSVWGSLISGIFFVYYGTTVGLSSFQWSLMAGISSWLIAGQLLSAYITERLGERKLIWFIFVLLDRGLRFVGIAVSFWLYRTGHPGAGLVLIATVCLGNLFGTMAAPPWLSWLADIVPKQQHGAFWGRRSTWISLSVLLVVVPAGFLLDHIPEAGKLTFVVGIFTLATIVGIADIFIHGTIPEPVMKIPGREKFFSHILQPLGDHRFRPWLTFNVLWTFGMTMGGALATIYFLDGLGIRQNFLGGTLVLTGLTLLGTTLSGRWTGRLLDRKGVKWTLVNGHLFWALLPLFWLLATPGTALVMLGASSVIGGIASSAAANAATKYITRLPAPDHRAMYTAVSSSLGSMAGGLGVLTAGFILRTMGDTSFTLGGFELGGFRVLFLVSLTLRLIFGTVLLRRLPIADKDV